jgi:hypothetical protein
MKHRVLTDPPSVSIMPEKISTNSHVREHMVKLKRLMACQDLGFACETWEFVRCVCTKRSKAKEHEYRTWVFYSLLGDTSTLQVALVSAKGSARSRLCERMMSLLFSLHTPSFLFMSERREPLIYIPWNLPNLSGRTMLLGSKVRRVLRADNLTAICDSTVYKMWDP